MNTRILLTLLIGTSIGFCLAAISDRVQQYQAPSYVSLKDFSPPKLWGRKSHVPDWQAAERIDSDASRHFIMHWAPNLPEFPALDVPTAKPSTNTVPNVIAVPHWLEINPFHDARAIAPYKIASEKFAALGESEPFSFAIRSPETLPLTAGLDSWRFEGKPVPALSHSIRLVAPYRVRAKAGKRDTEQVLKPMVLLADETNSWTFPASYTMVIVADVHLGTDLQPGIYTANFNIKSAGETLHETPISVEVLPFELRVNNFHVGAFGTTYDIWAGGFSGYYPAMIEMDSRYGFNIAGGFFNKGNEIPFTRDPGGRLIVDRSRPKFKKFDNTMATLRAHGMGDVAFWNWGGSGKYFQFLNVLKAAGIKAPFESPEGKAEFGELLRAIKDVEIARGWPEIVINPYDEALKDQQATREIIESIPYVRASSPATRLYMTEWRSGYTRHYQSSGKQLFGEGRPREAEYKALMTSGEAPIANFDVIGSNVLDAKGRALQDKLGGEYWNYTGAWSNSPTTQFGLGFRAWITRSETVLIWANYKGSLQNHGWTVHHPLPLDPNGRKNRNTAGPVLAGAQSYAVREGIDDRKYLETLRYHAWRTGSEEDWRYVALLSKRAKALLKNPRSIGGIDNVPGRLSEETNLAALRAELKTRIIKLLQLPSTH